MTQTEFAEFTKEIAENHALLVEQIEGVEPAASDVESVQHAVDALAEALFLRAFTSYETNLEKLFFHYVTGGKSLGGVAANSYLRAGDEQIARRMVKGGFKFMSWAKPDQIRQTASTFIEKGWPIVDMLATKTQELADCERIRNRIAHNSIEATVELNVVQRNLFSTERLFPITPGQLLRIRHKKHKKLHLSRFMDVMKATIEAIIDPPQ